MTAKYIIQTNDRITEFEDESIGIIKCLQIKRIADAKKTWKGYSLFKMDFSVNGLNKLHIIKWK